MMKRQTRAIMAFAIGATVISSACQQQVPQSPYPPYYNPQTGQYTYTDPNNPYYPSTGTGSNYYGGGSYGSDSGYSPTYGYGVGDGVPISNLPTGTVTGRVVDSLTNLGVPGVTVEVVGVLVNYNDGANSSNTRRTLSTTTDASGQFTLTNVPQGRQMLAVSKADYTTVAGSQNTVVDILSGSTVSSPTVSIVPYRASSANGFVRAFDNFKLPRGIAINQNTGEIMVIDVIGAGGLLNYERSEVKRLNPDGGLLQQFGSDLLSWDLFRLLKRANGVGIDSGGNVFIADTGHDVVKKYGSSGLFISDVKKGFKQPFDIAILTTGELIVSDPGNSRAVLLDSSMNVKIESLGNLQSDGIRGVATDNANNIYVVDASAKMGTVVRKFDERGNELDLHFGTIGGIEPGQFNNPTDIAIDNRNGDIYIVDTGNNRVQRFSSEGSYLSEFGSFGSINGSFNAPWGIAVDQNGFVFVTDSKNKRVQKFMPGRFGETY